MAAESCRAIFDPALPHFTIPTAHALDMDRTLIQVPASVERLIRISEEFGVSGRQITAAQQEVEADGGTFDPLQFIQSELSADDLDDFGDKFIRTEQPALTCSDTEQLFNRLLADPVTPHLLVTYGRNRLWQAMKTAGGGCYGYMEIMDTTLKGPQIASWRGPQDTFDFVGLSEKGQPLAVYHARSVQLTDDKVTSFTGLPLDATGACLVRSNEVRLPSQQGEIPAHLHSRISVVSGLGELAVPKQISLAQCGRTIFFEPGDMPEPFAFRPAYPTGEANPGLLVTPAMSFAALQATVEYL